MQLQTEATRPLVTGVLHGSRIIARDQGERHRIHPVLAGHSHQRRADAPVGVRTPSLKLIRVCKEDEGIGVCAGLSYCDKRALLLMQYSGMLDSINALRIVGVEYSLPICMMVGLLNKEPGVRPEIPSTTASALPDRSSTPWASNIM